MPYTPGTITGTFQTPDGEPRKGTVSITLNVPRLRDQAEDVVFAGRVSVELDETGSFSTPVAPSDDPGLDPSGADYRVAAHWASGERSHVWPNVFVPSGGTVDVADVGVLDPAAPSYQQWVNEAGTSAVEAAGSAAAAQSSEEDAEAAQVAAEAAQTGAETARDAAVVARTGAEAAQAAAESVPTTTDGLIEGRINDPDSASRAALDGLYAQGHNPALRKWYAALGNRRNVPAQVLVIGDSNSEGTGATSFTKRWQRVLQDNLRAAFPVPGVAGAALPYVSASPRQVPALTDAQVTKAGTTGTASFGLGMKALALSGADGAVTFTFTGDRCKLLVTKGGTGTNRIDIALDGGAAVRVNTFNSGTLPGQMVWDSGALSAAAHTVTVTRVDAQTPFIEGLLTYNGDHGSGVRVIDSAKHGTQADAFSASTAWHAAVTNSGPYHLAVLPLGTNDANAGVTTATFKARVEALLAGLRTAGFAGSILLVGMPKRSEASVTDAEWAEYHEAMRQVAAVDADVAFLDLRARIPDAGTAEATALDLYADTVHYKPGAQGWIADEVTNAITPR